MLVISYSRMDDLVEIKSWFWHKWDVPVEIGDMECAPPRSYLRMDHEKVISAKGIRVLGIEIVNVRLREIEDYEIEE